MLASPGEVGQRHIKTCTEPHEEEEPLLAIGFRQQSNVDLWAIKPSCVMAMMESGDVGMSEMVLGSISVGMVKRESDVGRDSGEAVVCSDIVRWQSCCVFTILASPGEVVQMHMKTEPQEEEQLLSAIVTLLTQNAEWKKRCLELEAENEELKEDIKELRERRGEGEEGNWKERGEMPVAAVLN